jgi:hypothetical protein
MQLSNAKYYNKPLYEKYTLMYITTLSWQHLNYTTFKETKIGWCQQFIHWYGFGEWNTICTFMCNFKLLIFVMKTHFLFIYNGDCF